MSIDTSVTTDEPDTSTQPGPDGSSAEVVADDDYSTEAGGPTMIWLFTGIFVVVTWLRRRHRKRRQQR
ncbi:hypothetical protein [Mycolicibacterium tokaiense]|uniref:Uncharacterized protein n=1 Tax=Mycolicibacterium tokaiense TaxID=39695 RepID=A0A378T8A7_9MYCO|nr:hypothetical protein [Mycolicibacterium tokaiense]BBY88469.1 hypothetical protein MTOK_42510 [Mycolicibacterium tokaiense]STZ57009.1 Uncharacterised protein [Mycolicibacterium tokaiense]